MSLSIEKAVLGMADLYRDSIGPTLTDNYAIENNRLAVIMLTIMGNAADDAVALRVAENGAVRALLGQGAAHVADPALAAQLAEAAGSTDPGLRIGELDGEADRLRRLLIDLQIALEADPASPAAHTLDQAIWRQLQTIQSTRAPRL